ncbi:MAG: hypothetical protein WB643_06465 [Candidatus Bathyarchaeia archaeon]
MQEILAALEGLKRGDRVVVLWHDACRVTNDPDVRAEYYSTPKETQGTVYDCVPDPDFPTVYYLIISGETTMGKADYYDAIPVAWIAKIERLEVAVKHPKMAWKLASHTSVDRILLYRDRLLRSDSGGVDRLPKKWSHLSGPQKFIEEIIKVVQ